MLSGSFSGGGVVSRTTRENERFESPDALQVTVVDPNCTDEPDGGLHVTGSDVPPCPRSEGRRRPGRRRLHPPRRR